MVEGVVTNFEIDIKDLKGKAPIEDIDIAMFVERMKALKIPFGQ